MFVLFFTTLTYFALTDTINNNVYSVHHEKRITFITIENIILKNEDIII